MENYNLVKQWAATIKTDKAFQEIEALRLKYPWLRCEKSFDLIHKINQDLPRVLHIIILQEKQNTMLRHENEKLKEYIKVNRMADELLLDEIKEKYPLIDI